MIDKRIEFDERYDNKEEGTTTLYFIAPKELLPREYPEAVSMEISVEFQINYPEARYADVQCSPTKYDEKDDCYIEYDWYDISLPYDEIEELIALAEKEDISKDKKANMAYWDSIDDLTEEYVKNLLKYNTSNITLYSSDYTKEDIEEMDSEELENAKGNGVMEIAKEITEFAVKLLEGRYNAKFPYVNEEY